MKEHLWSSELFTLNLDERKLCTALSYLLLILMKENFVHFELFTFNLDERKLCSTLNYLL